MNDGDAYEALVQFLYRAPIGLIEVANDGTVQMINPCAGRWLMPLSADGTLDNLFDVLAGAAPGLRDDAQRVPAAGDAAAALVRDGLRLALPPGRRRREGDPDVLALSVMRLDAQRLMAVLHDATADVQREQQRERRAARVDALTRMPNRTAACDHLAPALARRATRSGPALALLYVTADRFGQVNARACHAVGDAVLALMAARLRHALREGDDALAARVGGDEFAVVLTGAAAAHAAPLAERLVAALGQPYVVDGQAHHVGVSIGLLAEPESGHDADRVLHDAALAMAEAKRRGGGRVVAYTATMHDEASRRGALELALRQAIAGGELFVVYQPVLCLASGRLRSVEALVRWQHPQRGLVAPGEFIAVAEDCGLIGAIGRFVLETACTDFARWRQAHGDAAPQAVAVNLSRAQLAEPDWVAHVAATVARHGLAAGELQLEVTESLAAQDAGVQHTLHALRAAGVTLALDDFGTGYSSLSSLHQLPVDTLKIDRSFVGQVDTSRHHRVLIDATVRVARSLGLRTVAEGIETEDQARALHELGCDRGQGYLFARPLTPAALQAWIAARDPAAHGLALAEAA